MHGQALVNANVLVGASWGTDMGDMRRGGAALGLGIVLTSQPGGDQGLDPRADLVEASHKPLALFVALARGWPDASATRWTTMRPRGA